VRYDEIAKPLVLAGLVLLGMELLLSATLVVRTP
jgi:hypothetical protein